MIIPKRFGGGGRMNIIFFCLAVTSGKHTTLSYDLLERLKTENVHLYCAVYPTEQRILFCCCRLPNIAKLKSKKIIHVFFIDKRDCSSRRTMRWQTLTT